ncbi:MAG: Ldh family oxidoreductase [Planctomycetaceae bacterium]|nr:Ldh family oxidoreductase [Planctomycetaceae bacterium]
MSASHRPPQAVPNGIHYHAGELDSPHVLSANLPTTKLKSSPMPTLTEAELIEVGRALLTAAKIPAQEIDPVALHLADANMVGHDSHGVMRLVQYLQMVDDGFVKPGAPVERVVDGPAFCVLDGHFNFGQVIAGEGLRLALEKARGQGTATVFMRNCNHIGRLGAYTEAAAQAGFTAVMAVNAPGPGGVAPFGGIDRRLGTNPISMASPAPGGAVVLDMTTSATAEGKLRVAHQKGESIPPGLIIDGHGNPSTDPADYYNKPYGAILPLGGPLMGHKGFGLSVMLDLICGLLSGSGLCRTDLPRGANGVWLHLMEVERFLPRAEYDQWITTYIDTLKSTRTLPGVSEILLPGEIERRRRQLRESEGVPIPDETWRQLTELAAKLGATLPTIA